jgi:hypothetical protein
MLTIKVKVINQIQARNLVATKALKIRQGALKNQIETSQ